ncbi:hypothetical protein LCGC14_1720650 [marine sediment metagenome]|uniref:Uncharacterized protein n=1 Tax=marine sediment metagenome TaxID=412755 RepID=A0A0F9HCD1_9ZZZZ
MSYPSHPLVDLVIPNGTAPSNAIAKNKFKTARALSISSPSALTNAVAVQGKGVDGTWRIVQVDGADLNVTAGDITLVDYPGRFEELRLNSAGNEGAERTFECQFLYELD